MALKGGTPEQLVGCVRAVHAGERWLEGGLAGLVSQGLRNKEIAARLGIGEGTVKMHLVRVYGKLGVTNRVELANRLRREGG